jgi:serine protease
MRLFICAIALSTAAIAGGLSGSAELNPVRTHPHSLPTSNVHQVIVKLRAARTSAAASAANTAEAKIMLTPQARVANLAARVGLKMEQTRSITDNMHVMMLDPASADDAIETTLARLRADPDVEYAEADARRYIHAAPNDPLYPLVSPASSGQWYEQNDPSTPAAVNAVAAWAITTGDPNLVIADLDTGVRFDHPDLLTGSSGRLLAGYDFITDPVVANDGDGRDADASDPGDWVTETDIQNLPEFKNCTVSSSSWHGTRTAGILGALTNNKTGIAGMTWQDQILPVRVLGKCGGVDSDIIAGMLWAAGIHVDGVPDNTTPARIINMSLGGTGACPSSYADAITQVTALGVLVVVSAGNEGGPVDTPANCAGVAGVAGIRQAGTKVGFSSLGPEIALAAPAGNCVNTTITSTAPCEYSIETTVNTGSTTPSTNSYTDQVANPNLGTSFSAPIVSGIGALMLAANSKLNSCQLISRLKEGSTPFPQTSTTTTTMCHVPASSDDLQTVECICTADDQTCGTGMANALGAVNAALRPIAAVALPASVTAGQSVTLNAQGSAAANGHTISSYSWTSTGSQAATIQNGSSATATVTAPSCGYSQVHLVVTDDGGRVDAADVVLSPTSATSTAPTAAVAATACSNPPAPQVLVAVCPAVSTVQAGTGTQSFTATVANTTNDTVTWEVNGVVGGNSTVGTISTTGVYTAPPKAPSPSTVMIQAVSTADQTVTSATSVTVTNPPSSSGGGAMDLWTVLAEALALGMGLASRRYARRWAASSQVRCARL